MFNSRSELFEHLLWNDAVMRRQVGDVCKPIAEWLTHSWKPLSKYRWLVGDKASIDHHLIADQSQVGCHYIAKILAVFVVKATAPPSDTGLWLT